MKKYYGVIPPIITPIDENEKVDEKGFRGLLDYCVDGGLQGIFVAGTNGETMQLTQRERNRAIEIALDQVNGRCPVIAGVMDTSTQRVIDNIHEVEKMGGSCVAVTPIFYDRHTSQDETIRHFDRILEHTNVDVMVYNIPAFVGDKITANAVIKIGKMDKRVVGYKDSSGSYGEFLQVLAAFRDTDFSVLQGLPALAMSSMLMGADGFVPALAPAFPEMFVSAYEAGKNKNVELAVKYNDLLRESSKINGMSKNATAAAKYAISLRGFTNKRVIWPQDTILPEEELKIQMKLKEVDALYEALKTEA